MSRLSHFLDMFQNNRDQKTEESDTELEEIAPPSEVASLPAQSTPTSHYVIANVRALVKSLSKKELRSLCKDVPEFRSVYEDLRPNAGKAQILKSLLGHLKEDLQIENPQ